MSLTAPLSPRELEVMEAMRAGAFSYGAIARSLTPAVSVRTAEALVRSIAEKIDGHPGPPLARVLFYAAQSAQATIPGNPE